MFKPKMYKSNGLEAYRLVSDEGGSFLYEGRIEYSEEELYTDGQGRAYYMVTSAMGSASKYYVEVEPEGKPLPSARKKERDISSLIVSSPRPGKETNKAVEPHEEVEPSAVNKQPNRCFEGPEEKRPPAEEDVKAAVKAMASLGEHKPHKKRRLGLLIGLLIIIIIVAIAVGVCLYKPELVSSLKIPFIK